MGDRDTKVWRRFNETDHLFNLLICSLSFTPCFTSTVLAYLPTCLLLLLLPIDLTLLSKSAARDVSVFLYKG